MVDTTRIIKATGLNFGEFLQFSGIWMLMTADYGTNQVEYFIENPIDIFGWFSNCVNQRMSENNIEIIFYALKCTTAPLPTFEINFMKYNR